MNRFTILDRRIFLTAGAALGASALCGSAARALTPIPVYLGVEFIAVTIQYATREQELNVLLPEYRVIEPPLIDHIQQGVMPASHVINVVQDERAPSDHASIRRILWATVRTDLASSPFAGAPNELIGVTSLLLRNRYSVGDADFAYVPTPMTIFGARKDKAAFEIALIEAAKRQIDANLIGPVLQAN
jgi:hypothetical protein